MLFGEIDANRYGAALATASTAHMSALTDYEIRVVLGPRGEAMLRRYDALLVETGIVLVDFDEGQSRMAFEAYRRYGEGNHPAGLNLGDCASYALAKNSTRRCCSRAPILPARTSAARARRQGRFPSYFRQLSREAPMIRLLSLVLAFVLTAASPALAQGCDDAPPPPPQGDQPTT